MIAPGQLPFAPRPISGEVLSSWLMRVAAANLVQLVDLLEALETHHGQVLASDLLDYSIPEKAVTALSKFCRIFSACCSGHGHPAAGSPTRRRPAHAI